jgi:hypothetical protein
MLSKLQFKEWFDRYKYAELAATTTALLCSQLSRFFNPLSTAYLITFAEYFAFYAVIVTISYRQLAEQNKDLPQKKHGKTTIVMLKNLLLEFGYPVILDLFFIRPFFMYTLPLLTGNTLTGIIAGKISADIVFYFLTIVNYELLKNRGPV